MSALSKFDSWLIDDCSQPIINLTMQHPALVALVTSLGGVFLMMMLSWVNFDVTKPALCFVELCGFFVQSYIGLLWLRSYPVYRRLIKPGFSNPFRGPLLPIRLLMLGSTMVLTAASMSSDIHLSDILFVSGITLYTISQYFLVCTCPIPKVSVRKGFLYDQVPEAG